MLTIEDCIALSELTPEEVDAIAEHEHLPSIAAVELGNYLIHRPGGAPWISRMIVDDIAAAAAHGDLVHAAKLKLVLQHFIAAHAQGSGSAT